MRLNIVVFAIAAVLALGTSPALALVASDKLTVSATDFTISGSPSDCSTGYAGECPAADDCTCYFVSQASLHSSLLIHKFPVIPPGTTDVAVAVDTADGATSTLGSCSPAYGTLQYTSKSGTETATIDFFSTFCTPVKPTSKTSPITLSGGGGIDDASGFPGTQPSGWGTVTATYDVGLPSRKLSLTFIVDVTP